MFNLHIYPSQRISVIQNFCLFHKIKTHDVDLWKNDMHDYSVINGTNTILVIDYKVLYDTLLTPDSYDTLVSFLNKKNQIVVWYDNDSVILFHHIYPHILKLDNLLKTQCVNIVVDSCLINEPVFNNINVTYMRHGWFEKEVFRKIDYNIDVEKKDFILTMSRQDKHRDILWSKLESENLLDNGFSVYHKTVENKHTNEWIGSKSSAHQWNDGHPSMELYNNSYFEIVPETLYDGAYFITEKTIKPLVCKMPFLVVSSTGYLHFLKCKGYKTFNGIINESYDLEENLEKRIEMVVEQVKFIIDMGSDKFYQKSVDIRNHNFSKVCEIAGEWWTCVDETLYKLFRDIECTIK